MDLKQLEYFVQVAEMAGFTRAAAVLQVAQPALSRQVRLLEVELRQPLFERNGRGVTLTPAGQRLLEHARGILQQVQRARLDLQDLRGVASGRLVLALPPSVSRMLTTPLVAAFRQRLPKATLSVMEGLSAYTLEWLASGRVDAAVVYNVAPSSAVELLAVLSEPLFLVSKRKRAGQGAAVGTKVRLADVATHALVIPSRPHSIRMLLETALAAQGLRARVALEIESIPAILELVAQGGVHAVLSLNALRASGHQAALQARAVAGLNSTLSIATSTQRPRGPLIEQSVGLVRELLLKHWG